MLDDLLTAAVSPKTEVLQNLHCPTQTSKVLGFTMTVK